VTAPHLLLVYDFPPIGGGIARWMGEMALRYPDRSLIVSTGSVEGSEASDARFPITIDRISTPARRLRTIFGLFRWIWRLRSLARDRKVEFVWCGNLRPAAYAARQLKSLHGIPYGVILHGGDLLTLRSQARTSARKRRFAASHLGHAHVLATNSQFTRDLALEFLTELGVETHPSRVRVLPLGTDPARFHPDVDPGAANTRFSLEEGRWLLTVARLTPHKGIDTALRALARLAPRYPDLRYAVAGQGEDGPRLAALAAELGVTDRVKWLGSVGDDLLPSLYRNAIIYLGLSRREGDEVEGFGISLVEASGSAVPVVGGRSGGVPDAVRDGATGVLVDPLSVEEVERTVANLLDDEGLARRLGAGGRLAVEEFYNWDRVARELRGMGDHVTAALRGRAR
jgi:phosphatidyl-myo-inositol dimannoside synthase